MTIISRCRGTLFSTDPAAQKRNQPSQPRPKQKAQIVKRLRARPYEAKAEVGVASRGPVFAACRSAGVHRRVLP